MAPKGRPDAQFDRYTRQSRDMLRFAHVVAAEAKIDVVSVEHLLLGLIWAAPQGIGRFLPPASVESLTAQLSRDVPRIAPPGGGAKEVAFSPDVVRILERAAEDAGESEVFPEHMMLAIMREYSGRATELLRSHGVDVAELQRFVHPTRA